MYQPLTKDELPKFLQELVKEKIDYDKELKSFKLKRPDAGFDDFAIVEIDQPIKGFRINHWIPFKPGSNPPTSPAKESETFINDVIKRVKK